MKKILFDTTIGFAMISLVIGVAYMGVQILKYLSSGYEFNVVNAMLVFGGLIGLILCNRLGEYLTYKKPINSEEGRLNENL